jgi:hypothetical protein
VGWNRGDTALASYAPPALIIPSRTSRTRHQGVHVHSTQGLMLAHHQAGKSLALSIAWASNNRNFAMEIRKSRGQVTDSGLPPTPSLMGPRSISGAVPIIGVDSPPVSGQQAPLVREGSRLQHAAGGSGALRSVLSNAGNLPSPLKNAYPGSGHRMTWADLPKEVSQVLGDEILELPVVPDSPQAGLVPRPPPSSAPATSALPAVRGSGGGYSESSNAVPAPTTPTVLDEHPGGTGTGEEVASTSPWAVPQPPPEVQAAQRRESSRAGTPLAVVVPAPTGASLVRKVWNGAVKL